MYNFEALWRTAIWLVLVKMTIFYDFHDLILTLTEEQGQQKKYFRTQGSLYYNHMQIYLLSAKKNFKVIWRPTTLKTGSDTLIYLHASK